MRIGEAATGVGEEMADVGLAIQRAEDKTASMRARAAAVEELEATGTLTDFTEFESRSEVERELAKLGLDSRVEAELEADEGGVVSLGRRAVLGRAEPSRARSVLVQGSDAARITLEVEFGLRARAAAIAFDPLTMPSGDELLTGLAESSGAATRQRGRLLRPPVGDAVRAVTPTTCAISIGVIAESVEQAGCAEQLVCAVFAFERRGVYLIYNFARAAFHVFVPRGEGRDTEQEQRLQAVGRARPAPRARPTALVSAVADSGLAP